MLGLRFFVLYLVAPAGGVPNVTKIGVDTATLAESASITVTLVASDTGTLADNGVQVSDIDVIKTGVDAFTLSLEEAIVFSIPGDDTYLFADSDTTITTDDNEVFGTLAESALLAPVVTVTDPISLSLEQGLITLVTVDLQRSDTATLAEDGRVNIDIPASDTASLAEAGVVDEITGPLDVDVSASDAFTFAEVALVAQPITDSDSAVLAEANLIVATGELPLDTEGFTFAEATTLTVTLVVADPITLIDSAAITVSQVGVDAFTLVDVLETFTAAVTGTEAYIVSQKGDNGVRFGELFGSVTIVRAIDGTVTLAPTFNACATLFGVIDGTVAAGV